MGYLTISAVPPVGTTAPSRFGTSMPTLGSVSRKPVTILRQREKEAERQADWVCPGKSELPLSTGSTQPWCLYPVISDQTTVTD